MSVLPLIKKNTPPATDRTAIVRADHVLFSSKRSLTDPNNNDDQRHLPFDLSTSEYYLFTTLPQSICSKIDARRRLLYNFICIAIIFIYNFILFYIFFLFKINFIRMYCCCLIFFCCCWCCCNIPYPKAKHSIQGEFNEHITNTPTCSYHLIHDSQ